MQHVRIVTPVYNDWVSFSKLLEELDGLAGLLTTELSVSAVNDGSTDSSVDFLHGMPEFQHLVSVEIIHLKLNVGHQRAIAIGLCVAAHDQAPDAVIVMDADGEDLPASIPLLLEAAGNQELTSVVAQRGQRQESLVFRTSYFFYKKFFYFLTGKTINFGNFSLHTISAVKRLTLVPDLWNNLAAAILRSRLPIRAVSLDRGQRYAGHSKMNYISLVVHGFSFISAYADTIFVRLLGLSLGLIALTVTALIVLVILRLFFPALATPGWATTIVFGLVIITIQLVMTALSSLLMLLNNRVQRLIRPYDEWATYVERREPIFFRSDRQDQVGRAGGNAAA